MSDLAEDRLIASRLAFRAVLACVPAVAIAAGVQAQALSRRGPEFQVNTTTFSAQNNEGVGMAADGSFVVVWSSLVQDGSLTGIFGQRFVSSGTKIGPEFQVNSSTVGRQSYAAVAVVPDGRFIVVWTSEEGGANDVFAKRFNAAGVPQATAFQVNVWTPDQQLSPRIDADADGDFVVIWDSQLQDGDSSGVFGRRFDSAGTPQATELQINSFTPSGQNRSAVALDGNGGFVVVWNEFERDGDAAGVFGRRFDAMGGRLATEFQVNTRTTGDQIRAGIDVAVDGDFVVSWSDRDLGNVFARHFDAAGIASAAEFQLSFNAGPFVAYESEVVADGASGGFVVAWHGEGDGSATGVFARRLDSNGTAQGSPFQVNSYTTYLQSDPRLASSGDGSFVIAWTSSNFSPTGTPQDGFGEGVFAQRFAAPALDVDGDGVVGALTDALLLLRFLFGFTGPTLTAGAVGPGCTRCDGASIVTFLADVSAALGSTTVAMGNEFQVNTHTESVQSYPAAAARGNGDFVVVWESNQQDGLNYRIFGQRFSSNGSALGTEFQAWAATFTNQQRPSIGVGDAGQFVVAWTFPSALVNARRFGAGGAPLGNELQVNASFTFNKARPAVAIDDDGFIVVWQSQSQDGSGNGIFGRRFNPGGTPLAVEFQVNSYTPGDQYEPAVAMGGGDDFFVVWTSLQDHSATGIFARRLTESGIPIATEFQVNSFTVNTQRAPAVATNSNGDFVVSWQSFTQDGLNWGVFARRFDFAGFALGSEFQVNQATEYAQANPAVALDDDGDFVIAYQSSGHDGSFYGIFARRYDSAGISQTGDLLVNSHLDGSQQNPTVSAGDHGDFVIAWQSDAQDGSSIGLFARRFATLQVFDVDGDGVVAPLTDGLLILRRLFGFTGPALTASAVGGGCTRCDAQSIIDYLSSLI